VLASAILAASAALSVATLVPSSSTGAADPVVARLAGPTSSAILPNPSVPAFIGAVAGIIGASSTDRQGQPGMTEQDAQPRLADEGAEPRVADGPIDPSLLTGYRWPLLHGRITLPFGPWREGSRIVDGEAFHDGLDLATFCGDRILAAHDGVVLAAGRHYDSQMGWVGDLGPYFERLDAKSLWTTLPIVVVVDDGNGYRSLYAHFGEIVVKRGEAVHAGQLLGNEGQTGHASGCHLHYGLFSPQETAIFGIDPKVAEHMKLPVWEIARIDPLLVLPARSPPTAAAPRIPGPRALRGDDASY
jgi:murein DD-endopeptidase MepM/ murein hydrolase activator NlpD